MEGVEGHITSQSQSTNRRIPVEKVCERRKLAEETIYHALRHCPKAIECWKQFQFEWDVELSNSNGNADWFTKMLSNLEQNALQHFAVAAWTILSDRNAEIHGENQKPVPMLVSSVRQYVSEYTQAQQRIYDPMSRPSQKWKPLRPGFVKVNFDGALDRRTNTGGIGIVIRNEKGLIMGAKAAKSHCFNEPFLAEAKAALSALIFAFEMGFQKIEVEGDALSIIKQFKDMSTNYSIIGNIIEEARVRAGFFNSCFFTHTGREGNRVADTLAKLGLTVDCDMIWIEDCPPCVEQFVITDAVI